MNKRQFADLSNHARERARANVMLTLQLLDDDQECAALLIYLAIDFINGATEHLLDDGSISEEEALGTAITMFMSAFGQRKIVSALDAAKKRKESSK